MPGCCGYIPTALLPLRYLVVRSVMIDALTFYLPTLRFGLRWLHYPVFGYGYTFVTHTRYALLPVLPFPL